MDGHRRRVLHCRPHRMSSMGHQFAVGCFAFALLLAPSVVVAEDRVPFGTLPAASERPPRYTIVAEVSAYTSRPEETDDTPFITASGTRVRDGIVAANGLKFGTRVRIPALFGDKVFVVEDRMNPRYGRDHMDLWMEDLAAAREFGRRRVAVEVF